MELKENERDADTNDTRKYVPQEGSTGNIAPPVVDRPRWDQHPENPLNWPRWRKVAQMVMLTSLAFISSFGTSIISPARTQLEEEFNVGSTAALLPLSLYCLALGLGPVFGGPLSETIGRYPVYAGCTVLGALFTLGAGFTHNFGALCSLRFLAGLCWGPSLAVAAGSIAETFRPKSQGLMVTLYILMPFLGPGFGPLIGGYLVERRGWRWTQWTLLLFTLLSAASIAACKETYHTAIRRRIAKRNDCAESLVDESLPSSDATFKDFINISLIRPLHMLCAEPIVAFLSAYISAEFGTLFCFFAAVPYTFHQVYDFTTETLGLVFIAIIVGCLLAVVTLVLCEIFIYRKKIQRLGSAAKKLPPEERLYAAMMGSVGLPVSLFWFAWTARPSISWASPAISLVLFSWGNLCIFVSAFQYMTDTYHRSIMASVASANSLARYTVAAAFPLFTLQMYKSLGIHWAGSLLGFIAFALMPVPWALYKIGPRLRERSKYNAV